MYISQEHLQEINSKLDELVNLVKNQTSKIYTAKEAAAYLGISIGYLYKLTHAEDIRFYKPNGKLIYFLKSDLDAWALRNPSPSQTEKERGVYEAA